MKGGGWIIAPPLPKYDPPNPCKERSYTHNILSTSLYSSVSKIRSDESKSDFVIVKIVHVIGIMCVSVPCNVWCVYHACVVCGCVSGSMCMFGVCYIHVWCLYVCVCVVGCMHGVL